MAKSALKDRPTVKTQAQLGVVLGVAESTVRHYLGEGMPPSGPSGFDIADCVAWYLREKTGVGVDQRKKLAEAIDREKAAQLKELSIREKNGELIQVSKAVQFVSQDYGEIKRALLSLSASISPSLPSEVRDLVTAEIDNKVRLKLHELANREASFVGDPEGEDD